MQKQAARRKRLVRLAYECGFEAFTAPFEAFSKIEAGDEGPGLTELLNDIPDEELGEVEAALKDFQGLQEAIRSLN